MAFLEIKTMRQLTISDENKHITEYTIFLVSFSAEYFKLIMFELMAMLFSAGNF